MLSTKRRPYKGPSPVTVKLRKGSMTAIMEMLVGGQAEVLSGSVSVV